MRIAQIFTLGYNGHSDDCDHRSHNDPYRYKKSYNNGSHYGGYRSHDRYNGGLLGILGR